MSIADIPDEEAISLPSAEQRFALVVGCNNSSCIPSNWATLQSAEKDARQVAYHLEQPPSSFKLLKPAIVGKDATATNIRQALKELIKKNQTKDDFLLFYFSGHAQPKGRNVYFVTYDFDKEDLELDPDGYFSMRWLGEILNKVKSHVSVLVILDCCYAGNANYIRKDFFQNNLSEILDLYDMDASGGKNPNQSQLILAAAGYNEQAEEINGQGQMTRWLIQALAGNKEIMDRMGIVDVYTIPQFLLNNMPKDHLYPLSGEVARRFVLAHHPLLSAYYRENKEKPALQQILEYTLKTNNYISRQSETNLGAKSRFLDVTLCEDALFEHLESTKIADFFSKPLVHQEEKFLPGLSEKEQLEHLGLLQNNHPTYGALLCFGEDPSRWVTRAITRCIDSSNNEDPNDLLADKKYKKGLLSQFEESCDFLVKRLGSSRIIRKEGSTDQLEIPYGVLREALANALVHREYEGRTDYITIEIYQDRVEISNPGDLPQNMSLESLLKDHGSHPRNPQIVEIFYLYGAVEELGKGIGRMRRFMGEAGLPEPQFEISQDKRFKVTLYRPAEVPSHELQGFFYGDVPNHGLHVWTEADLARYHSLREEFVNLSGVFDVWLDSEPQKRGWRIRVLWLQSEEGEHRHQALMACLSGVARDYPSVYDAGMDLGLLTRALDRLIFSESYLIPPLISVELSADELGTDWKDVRNILASAEKQFFEEHQAYPLLIVAGTGEQARQVDQALQDRLEIKLVDTNGHELPRIYSFSLESRTLKKENVYNRGLPITTKRLFGRKGELKTLTRAWNSERCRIVSIVAYGGTGKSALINTWLSKMRDQDYLGAEKVFAWSFYSQGTKENLVSADVFVNQALTWLAPTEPIPLNPWAQGQALARLIKQHRFLLVLDGLEPLQHPRSAPHVTGQLTDDSIRALLEELSDPDDWEGLCVITTRVPLTDLHRYEDGNQKEMGRVVQIKLENLSIGEGAALLKSLIKADARQRELEKAVEEVQGHALAITLLGNYIRKVHHGDLVGRFDLEKLTVSEQEGGHARRVMAAYERWLQQNQGFAELALLHVIGLFDRPADPEAMRALFTGVDLNPYTAALDRVGGGVWNRSVEALRGMGLLNKENPEWPGTIDAHPLVREHFRDELQQGDRRMWVEGNRRLYAYYRDTAPQRPGDSKSMNTLYEAVTHGSAAGLHQQVYDEVLLPRVWWDRRTSFSTRHLGMVGSDLIALSNYFQHRQWTQLQKLPLSEPARILILTNVGVRLRQLGRLVDARQCFGAVVREIESIPAAAQESEDASYAAAQYCELLVIAGKLAGPAGDPDTALVNGQRAIEFADRGHEPYFSMHARSSLSEVYFMLGDLEKANELFEQARAIDQEHHPKPPFLYSQSLFRYGYYLIETDRAQELLAGARKSEDWGRNGNDTSLLSRAIRSLILGAAHRAVIESGKRTPTLIREAEQILDEAIVEFRTAGYADYTVRGLLERAHFYRIRRLSEDYGKTLEDLDEATSEAQRGQMELLYADILLQRLACYLDFWPTMSKENRARIRDEIAKTLTEVTDLIKKLDYHRRDEMLVSLQTQAVQQSVVREPFGSRNSGSRP